MYTANFILNIILSNKMVVWTYNIMHKNDNIIISI